MALIEFAAASPERAREVGRRLSDQYPPSGKDPILLVYLVHHSPAPQSYQSWKLVGERFLATHSSDAERRPF